EDLAGLVGVLQVQVGRKIVRRGAGPGSQLGGDVVFQDLAGPAAQGGLAGVPVTVGGVVELEQNGDVPPGQSSNSSLLDDCRIEPGRGQGLHREQIGPAPSALLAQFASQ